MEDGGRKTGRGWRARERTEGTMGRVGGTTGIGTSVGSTGGVWVP